jgi:hypothetical protein
MKKSKITAECVIENTTDYVIENTTNYVIKSLDEKANINRRSIKIIPKIDKTVCVKCKRSEKNMTGSNKNSLSGVNIFSREQMCIDCEIRYFPIRFHGCGFCKRPIREKFSCSICADGFVNWIKDVIQPLGTTSKILRLSASRLLNKSINDIIIDPDIDRAFILRTDDGFYKWPGFYAGVTNRFSAQNIPKSGRLVESKTQSSQIALTSSKILPSELLARQSGVIHEKVDSKMTIEKENQSDQKGFFPIWLIPKLTEGYDIKLSDFKLKNLKSNLNPFDKILLNILEKNNIHLYSDVQINSESFPSNQIKIINPYDTRVIK